MQNNAIKIIIHLILMWDGWITPRGQKLMVLLDSESLALGGISPSHTRNDDSILNASKMNEHPHPIF